MISYEYEHTLEGEHFDFDCPNGRVFEIEHGINEDAKTTCPECGMKIKRLIGAPNFKFKNGAPTPKFFE